MSRIFARALSSASVAPSATIASTPASAVSNSSPLIKHYARLTTLWPKDRLRPDTSFVKSVIQHREARLLGAPPSKSTQSSSGLDSTSSAATDALSSSIQQQPLVTLSQQKELCEINALYALVDNRFSKKYPVSQELLRPTSNPTYYEDLLRDFEAAPTRRWWQFWILKMKGMVRWQ